MTLLRSVIKGIVSFVQLPITTSPSCPTARKFANLRPDRCVMELSFYRQPILKYWLLDGGFPDLQLLLWIDRIFNISANNRISTQEWV